jgi:hypothetical protein
MTTKQIKWYWREWAAVGRACKTQGWPCPDRHQLHQDALGYPASSKTLQEDEFDFVLAEMWKYSKSDDIDAQLRQQRQPRTRLEARIRGLIETLGNYVDDPDGYCAAIVHDLTQGRTVDWEDLSERRPKHGSPSPLMGFCWKLQNMLHGKNGFRARAVQAEKFYEEEEVALMEGEPF